MSSDEDNCTLSRLERLPAPVVDIISRHLESPDLKRLRLTSITMHNHLDFTLRGIFKKIQCELQPSDFHALKTFKEQPLARAVETLILVTPNCDCDPRRVRCRHRPGTSYISSLQKMVVDSVDWFPNLRAVGLKHKSAAELSFWKEATWKIEKPLEVFICSGAFQWGVSWSGTSQSSLHAFYRSSQPPSFTMDPNYSTLLPIGLVRDFIPGPLESILRSFKLHRATINGRKFRELSLIVEELTLTECILSYVTDAFPDERTRFRALNFYSCQIQPRTRSSFQMFFTELRDKTRVERLRFEQVGGFAFDWDGDGSAEDDGSKIPLLVEESGVKEALTKMINCVCVSERPPRGE
ncbi:hypothetical protein IWZ01DRAFT_485418 [Phyllosticta capitalensis]